MQAGVSITMTMSAADDRWPAQNVHRVILADENARSWFAWPDPTDGRNSEHWKPFQDRPLEYPKFAWRVLQASVEQCPEGRAA